MWKPLFELVLRIIEWLTRPKAPKDTHLSQLEAANEEAREARAAELDEKIADARDADGVAELLRDVTGAPRTDKP